MTATTSGNRGPLGNWLWSRQNADCGYCRYGTLQLRIFAMATTFWLSMGYNFSCMMVSDTQ